MSVSSDEIKQLLIEENDAFKKLYQKHQSYEQVLEKMNERPYLTTQEQMEATNIKKHKLMLKTQMEQIIQEHLKSPLNS